MRFYYEDKLTGLAKIQVLGVDWQEAEEYLLSDQNRRVRDILEDAIQKIGQKAIAKAEKQGLYQKLMTYLKEQETTLPGGKNNPDYHKQEVALEEYVKTYGLFVSPVDKSPSVQKTIEIPKTAAIPTEVVVDGNLEKFTKLVETCYRRGNPSDAELKLLERFQQKYAITQAAADQIIAKFSSSQNQQEAIDEFGLMYRAFVENDGEIDFEEQSQLIELQEELELTNEQVSTIETNVREELGLKE